MHSKSFSFFVDFLNQLDKKDVFMLLFQCVAELDLFESYKPDLLKKDFNNIFLVFQ